MAKLAERHHRVELPSLVDAQRTPIRLRSNGRHGAAASVLADTMVVRGRPRRLGATHGGGGTRRVSSSRTLQTGSVSPLALAGVRGIAPRHACARAARLLNS